MKLRTELLKSSSKNPRKITKAGIERLKKSIKDNPLFFEARPVLVNHKNDEYYIVGGHQRVEAARQLNLEEVPVYIFNDLDDATCERYMLLDNVNEGKWDVDLLLKFDESILNLFHFDFDLETKKTELDDTTEAFIKNMFYEPTDLTYPISECIDTSKADKIKKEIDESNLSDDKKTIYKRIADRLVVCNFSLIADYYANCEDLFEAELIEKLSLVIPSIPSALKNKLVELSAEFFRQYKSQKNEIFYIDV